MLTCGKRTFMNKGGIMAKEIDALDLKILRELQQDASQSLDTIAKKVDSSKTPVWNRIKKLRDGGIIEQYSVKLNAEALGLDACFFILIRTNVHEKEWQDRFLEALLERCEVQEAHRLAGDVDYILKIRVANAKSYDAFYQSLIAKVQIHNVTALLSMEEIKSTTMLPL